MIDIFAHAEREYPKESCGLIVAKGNQVVYKPCRNLSDIKDQFILDPIDYASVDGEIRAIVHSHADIDSTPSEADKNACNQSNLPWIIVSYPNKTVTRLLPEKYQSLIGREWDYPNWDCYQLAKDYYYEKGIDLPDFERGDFEWFKSGDNKILANLDLARFEQVKLSDIKEGDLLLFSMGSRVINHIGIYYGSGVVLHHPSNQLSRREPLNDSLLKRLTMVVRFKDDKS